MGYRTWDKTLYKGHSREAIRGYYGEKNQFSNPLPGHRSPRKKNSYVVFTVEITTDNTEEYIAAKSVVPKFFIIIFKLKNYGMKGGGISD